MHRLKKAWNYWMDLDLGRGIAWIPEKILVSLFVAGYVLLTIGMFWTSTYFLDLRHPAYGKNHYYMPAWERILSGCFSLVIGSVLGFFAIREGWQMRKHPVVRTLSNRVKKPYRRGKNRFKPTNRANRQ